MTGPDENRTITGWRRATRYYRRAPGLGWLAAVLIIPVLLAVVGWSVTESDDASTPTAASTSSSVPEKAMVPLSIVRAGNDITLAGQLTEAAHTTLVDAVKGVYGLSANVIDKVTVVPDAAAPDLTDLGVALTPAAEITDLGWHLTADTLTLTGTAPEDVRERTETAMRKVWPNVAINDQIQGVPAAPAPGGCPTLQADITALLQTPVSFDTAGSTLTPASQQQLGQIGDKIKACPGAKIAVNGYTDNQGGDAINVPLSRARAKAVADYLVSAGVPAPDVTSDGFGPANPIADNATPEGRAQNRRVEIVVS